MHVCFTFLCLCACACVPLSLLGFFLCHSCCVGSGVPALPTATPLLPRASFPVLRSLPAAASLDFVSDFPRKGLCGGHGVKNTTFLMHSLGKQSKRPLPLSVLASFTISPDLTLFVTTLPAWAFDLVQWFHFRKCQSGCQSFLHVLAHFMHTLHLSVSFQKYTIDLELQLNLNTFISSYWEVAWETICNPSQWRIYICFYFLENILNCGMIMQHRLFKLTHTSASYHDVTALTATLQHAMETSQQQSRQDVVNGLRQAKTLLRSTERSFIFKQFSLLFCAVVHPTPAHSSHWRTCVRAQGLTSANITNHFTLPVCVRRGEECGARSYAVYSLEHNDLHHHIQMHMGMIDMQKNHTAIIVTDIEIWESWFQLEWMMWFLLVLVPNKLVPLRQENISIILQFIVHP